METFSGLFSVLLCLSFRFKNGGKYVGEYAYGKKQGEGIFYYPDGSKYEGSWSENARNGYGKYYYVNGDTYEGDWVNNKKDSQGIYSYAATGKPAEDFILIHLLYMNFW